MKQGHAISIYSSQIIYQHIIPNMHKELERLGYVRCFINQTFPLFSPTCFTLRKARERLIYKKNIVHIRVFLVMFPLQMGFIGLTQH